MKRIMITVFMLTVVSLVYPQDSRLWNDVPENIKARKYFKRLEWFYKPCSAPSDKIRVENCYYKVI
ncbi:MAG: hypothetical protein HYV28_09515 [Ignavibacteriales bacterium]|nr:hypothetical protein [Ignavibacteriales bacterium]